MRILLVITLINLGFFAYNEILDKKNGKDLRFHLDHDDYYVITEASH